MVLSLMVNEQEILVHMLWADDRILMADSVARLQSQLDGLYNFCGKYPLIVNTLKIQNYVQWEKCIGISKFHF